VDLGIFSEGFAALAEAVPDGTIARSGARFGVCELLDKVDLLRGIDPPLLRAREGPEYLTPQLAELPF